MWLEAVRSIAAYLRDKGINATVQIGGYAPPNVRPDEANRQGCIFVMRDSERPQDTNNLIEDAVITISVDVWVKSSSPDLEEGYALLYELEHQLEKALYSFRDEVNFIADGVQLLNLVITERMGSAESLRPRLGSHYSIALTVYDSNK